jgi:hypothetical protein
VCNDPSGVRCMNALENGNLICPKKTMCACDCLMLLSIDVSGVGFACQSLHDCMCLVGIELSKCV